MMKTRTMLAVAVMAGTIGSGFAYAQAGSPSGNQQGSEAPLYDPAQLPAFKGKVAQYDVTPRGDVDGLILEDGTEVHLPPHLSTQLVATVRPGDAVTIHGLKARALKLVEAMSVTQDASGHGVVVDAAPHGGFGHHGPMHGPFGPGRDGGPGDRHDITVQGMVKMQLHGPRGEVNGVLLDNGAIIHLPPPEAERLAAQLAVGKTVAARGDGSKSVLGTSVAAHALGDGTGTLKEIAPPPFGPWGHREHGPHGRPGPDGGPDAGPHGDQPPAGQ
jgi:hypothetical protein